MVTYSRSVDAVFKALADPTRRSLLDELFARDGQTLSELEERFSMTRFGVMKHLKQLEEAGLVVAKRRGREKLHFLNPVPIRLVHDRWVSKYAEPWAAGLSGLKHSLESPMEKVFEIYIRTTPDRLWQAITTRRSGASTTSAPGSPRTGPSARPSRWVRPQPMASWARARSSRWTRRDDWSTP
jgi:DNA-binding transcriptional ArsR family regulator